MRICRRVPDDRRKVQQAARRFLVEVDVKARANVGPQRVQLVEKGRGRARPRRVEQLPGAAERLQPANHREKQRDSDAAGDQHRMSRVLLQRKVVPGMRDGDNVSNPHRFMNEPGATPTCGVLVDPDDVAAAFVLMVQERVAADHSVRQMQVDVAARREGREIAASGSHQFVGIDGLGLVADPLDPRAASCRQPRSRTPLRRLSEQAALTACSRNRRRAAPA